MYVDSHAHLDGKRFDQDREQVLVRARDAGIHSLVTIGTGDGPGTLDCAVKIADAYAGGDEAGQWPSIYATVGIHPHEAQAAREEDFAEIQRLSRHRRVIAWGEIGLDYYYKHSPPEVQKSVFVRQMEMAKAAKLPIVIHCRPSDNTDDAWQDCLGLMEEHWRGQRGILHCFTGTWEHARRALDMNFIISFAGNVTFPKAQQIQDAARRVPLDRMLIETDAPYLAPVPHRGKRNEPAFVTETARFLGELRGMSGEEMGAQTAENFRHFFSLPETAKAI
jgi:TatD DNase family protein